METDTCGRETKTVQNYKCRREFALNEKIYFLKRYGKRKGPKANWVSYVHFFFNFLTCKLRS